jgi:hypothetical protein
MIEHLFGSHEEFFEKLPRLLLVINKLYSGTITDWTPEGYLNGTMVFRRCFFLSFGPCIEGFK